MIELLRPKGLNDHRHHLSKLDPIARDYFESTFDTTTSATTKDAVRRRVQGMLRVPEFRDMFMSKTNEFSMLEHINRGAVIIVSTDKALLKKDACQTFGRYFIALLTQATEVRGSDEMPVYCYIDECQDYVADDDAIADLLDKARKRRVGLILAHQRMANINSANVKDALANTSIRIAGRNETDAAYLAKTLRCKTVEEITEQEAGSFAAWVRGGRPNPKHITVNKEILDKEAVMTARQYESIRAKMRARYSNRAGEAPRASDDFDGTTINGEAEEVKPAKPARKQPVIYLPGPKTKKRRTRKRPEDYTAPSDEL